ncbi:MAG: sporulation protein Cse60 [Bacilli bacterium]|nr:sporulation protein Cse60 [Bacilli bacterium]MDD4076796.1 sporulation protein Cse60 [Bacilli bacterium]MDD4388032.1 sporulation protein Cse60 [Bacilli bacterium]
MKVKLFDESHEKDLEEAINKFLADLDDEDIIDIKFQVSTLYDYKDQIYCYCAMVIYKSK